MIRSLALKRVYDPPHEDDGLRVLVDRLWPRGISRDKAKIGLWLKDIAPSDELRRKFHARPAAWEAFRVAYAAELEAEPAHAAVQQLRELLASGTVTLLYAARDESHNNAVALKAWLEHGNRGRGK